MINKSTNDILIRIADALDRLAPSEKKINNLDDGDGFIYV